MLALFYLIAPRTHVHFKSSNLAFYSSGSALARQPLGGQPHLLASCHASLLVPLQHAYGARKIMSSETMQAWSVSMQTTTVGLTTVTTLCQLTVCKSTVFLLIFYVCFLLLVCRVLRARLATQQAQLQQLTVALEVREASKSIIGDCMSLASERKHSLKPP